MLDGRFDDDYFQESNESSQFRQEYEMRKIKQASHVLILLHSTLLFHVNSGGYIYDLST